LLLWRTETLQGTVQTLHGTLQTIIGSCQETVETLLGGVKFSSMTDLGGVEFSSMTDLSLGELVSHKLEKVRPRGRGASCVHVSDVQPEVTAVARTKGGTCLAPISHSRPGQPP
jgi:hypothetical protein